MSIEDKKIKEIIMGTLICDRKKFTDTTEIVSYMTDKQSLAFPSSILKFFQEIANSHCEEFNLGFESLSEKNVTFLLVNVRFSNRLCKRIFNIQISTKNINTN